MELNKEHRDILEHTSSRASGGLYCGDSPKMQELVQAGFMEFVGKKSFVPDAYFRITKAGLDKLKSQ